jgi:hypothetical protein
MSTLERRRLRVLVALMAALAAHACTEPVQSRAPKTQVDGALVARLEPSVAVARVGDIVQVALTVRGTGATDVGSFTARIAYDSTRLRYVGEVTRDDGALRVINPQPGTLRVAGIAPAGFSDGHLSAVRFSVVRADGLASLRLTVDEMHMTNHADARQSLHSSNQ